MFDVNTIFILNVHCMCMFCFHSLAYASLDMQYESGVFGFPSIFLDSHSVSL